jgi:hypothetical protein
MKFRIFKIQNNDYIYWNRNFCDLLLVMTAVISVIE